MFTGIITATEKVKRVARVGVKPRSGHATPCGNLFVRIGKPAGWKLRRGESVSVDGVCSTVRRCGRGYFEVEYMPETLAKTTASRFANGDMVNLERSLRVGARLGGHIVQGHVDATGAVREVRSKGNSRVLVIRFPARLRKLIAPKGSVCVNGVSLTVVDAGKEWLSVSLVSYTLQHTNLGMLKKGMFVNIEMDMLARYLQTLLTR